MQDNIGHHIVSKELARFFKDPAVEPPPKGEKLILLTIYGIIQVGPAHDMVAAWMPLPCKPKFFKESL